MNRLTTLPSGILLLTCCLSTLQGEDWREFRGPTGQGLSQATGLPLTWSETDNVRWKVPVDGLGWSSPIVSDGRIYLTTSVKNDDVYSLGTLCLNAADGETIWDREVFRQDVKNPASRVHNKNSHASPTPLCDGKHIYVHFGTHGTACLTLEGDVVWRNEDLDYAPNHGNGGSPVLVDGILAILCDGSDVQFAVGLDAKTGSIRWKSPRKLGASKKFSFSTPLVIDVDGQKQLISPGSGGVIAYDPRDGREIWQVDYGEGYSVVPRPAYGNGLVYVCTGFNRASLLAIRPTGQGNVTDTHVAWQLDRDVPRSSSLLPHGKELYFASDNGTATCLDAVTGRIHWQERIRGAYSASPLFAEGRIYFPGESGETVVVKADKQFSQLAKNQVDVNGERWGLFASFAVVDSAILLRTRSHLYRIESR
ncbi:MAG: serine/threonine protein kinase [Planctomycetaceae bacterium]|nr:serine/threonine protein kinase [Planctomycetaceae bacterium]